MVIAQVHARFTGTDGLSYVGRRGGGPVAGPFQNVLTPVITRVEVFNDGRTQAGTAGDRDSIVYGNSIAKPDTASTGNITPVSVMTDFNPPGSQSALLTTDNQIIRGKRIYGTVVVAADNVLIEDCILFGASTTPGPETPVVDCRNNVHLNTVLRDCTIAARWPNPRMEAAVSGNAFTAERLHIFWCPTGFAIYNSGGSGQPTNVKILGCLVEAMTYFHGDGYASPSTSYLNNVGGYTAWGTTSVVRPVDAWTSADGHNGSTTDGVRIKGGYGGMVRNPADGSWSGDGILLLGNYFHGFDAEFDMPDPSEQNLIVPGQAGSLALSQLGTQDSMRRGVNQSPSMGIPFTGGVRNTDSHYPANGAGLSVNPVSNILPFPSAAEPTKYTVVASRNWFDGNSSAVILQRGLNSTLGVALLGNRVGPHLYEFSPGTNPSTYPIRLYVTVGGVKQYEGIQFAPPDSNPGGLPSGAQGNAGLATQVWDDPANRFGTNGTPLLEGRNSGIVYS